MAQLKHFTFYKGQDQNTTTGVTCRWSLIHTDRRACPRHPWAGCGVYPSTSDPQVGCGRVGAAAAGLSGGPGTPRGRTSLASFWTRCSTWSPQACARAACRSSSRHDRHMQTGETDIRSPGSSAALTTTGVPGVPHILMTPRRTIIPDIRDRLLAEQSSGLRERELREDRAAARVTHSPHPTASRPVAQC